MTQKIVQTTEHELSVARAIIKRQEGEIDKLKLDLRQLRQARKTKTQPAVNQPTPILRDRVSSGIETDRPQTSKGPPPYARSTKASLLRRSPSPTSVSSSSSSSAATKHVPQRATFAGKAYAYKNGTPGPVGPNYLRSTKATVNKFGDHEQRREEKCGVFRPPPVNRNRWAPTPDPYAVSTVGPDEEVQPQQPVQILERPVNVISQEEIDDRTERERLETQTRLSDDDWLLERSNNVWLDHNKTYEILFTAERLGKECWLKWLRINRPKKYTRYLSDVDFGRDRLSRFLDTEISYRATRPYEFRGSLDDIIQLRNHVHHFGGCSLESTDRYLYYVQNFAVRLYDEERAHAARALRDRLRREAEEVARELETARDLTALPFTGDYQWKPYHVTLFSLIDSTPEWRLSEEYSTAGLDSATEFARRGSDVSLGCEQAVEASLAKVLRLASGDCGGEQ